MSIPKLLLPTLAVGGLYSQTVLANQAPTAFQVSKHKQQVVIAFGHYGQTAMQLNPHS